MCLSNSGTWWFLGLQGYRCLPVLCRLSVPLYKDLIVWLWYCGEVSLPCVIIFPTWFLHSTCLPGWTSFLPLFLFGIESGLSSHQHRRQPWNVSDPLSRWWNPLCPEGGKRPLYKCNCSLYKDLMLFPCCWYKGNTLTWFMQHKIKIFLKIFAHVWFGQFGNFIFLSQNIWPWNR